MHRDEAKELGLKYYVPDKPCKRGHWIRETYGGGCRICKNEYQRNRYKENPEYFRNRQKEYRKEKGDEYREYIREYMREYSKTDKYQKYIKKYKSEKKANSSNKE